MGVRQFMVDRLFCLQWAASGLPHHCLMCRDQAGRDVHHTMLAVGRCLVRVCKQGFFILWVLICCAQPGATAAGESHLVG